MCLTKRPPSERGMKVVMHFGGEIFREFRRKTDRGTRDAKTPPPDNLEG